MVFGRNSGVIQKRLCTVIAGCLATAGPLRPFLIAGESIMLVVMLVLVECYLIRLVFGLDVGRMSVVVFQDRIEFDKTAVYQNSPDFSDSC